MKRSELKALLEESYYETLIELVTEESRRALTDSTDEMMAKFPTLKGTITDLFTKEYSEFIKQIDWISPKPSTFRVVLKSDQDFILKWTGKGFEAQVSGKRYFLPKLTDYQQALDKLSLLMKDGEIVKLGSEEDAAAAAAGMDGGAAGGAAGGVAGGAPIPLGPDGEGEDLGGEELGFEDDEENPEI